MIKISDEIGLRSFVIKTHDRFLNCYNVEIELDGNSWYPDIRVFLKDGSYPEAANLQIGEY